MNIKTIIKSINAKKNTSTPLLRVFQDAFNEDDEVKLLRLRSLFVAEIEVIVDKLSKSDDEEIVIDEISIEVCRDFCELIAFQNLTIPVSEFNDNLSVGHISTMLLTYAQSKHLHDYKSLKEIEKLKDELKSWLQNSDCDEDTKELILSICDTIDDSLSEHKITGSKAISKLFDILNGKIAMYHEVIKKIDDEKFKTIFKNIYLKTKNLNENFDFMYSLAQKSNNLLGFLNV